MGKVRGGFGAGVLLRAKPGCPPASRPGTNSKHHKERSIPLVAGGRPRTLAPTHEEPAVLVAHLPFEVSAALDYDQILHGYHLHQARRRSNGTGSV